MPGGVWWGGGGAHPQRQPCAKLLAQQWVLLEAGIDGLSRTAFSRAGPRRSANRCLLYYMPPILIRIDHAHDKQLNNYSSLY